VRVWDKDGKASAYSGPACWEMGLLSPQDWQGQWIARTTDIDSLPAPLLRRAFTLDGKIKQARAYICGLGYYELRLNGKKIGDHLLDPGYTRFDKRALYVTYDVTDAVRRGKNAVGVILGNGWYNVQTKAVWDFHKAPWRAAPKLLMQVRVEYADGRVDTIGTDSRWTTSTGPITFDSIYGGRLTTPARRNRAGTRRITTIPHGPWRRWFHLREGKLVAQMMPPIKADQIVNPAKLTEPQPGIFVFDMGQNFAGFAELRLRAPAGTKVVHEIWGAAR